jgi:hypothetical protein
MKKTPLVLASLLALSATSGIVSAFQDLASEGKAWWAHVQFLADDKLEGRNVGSVGYDKAVDYVVSQFTEIGLKPAGTNGYRQPIKFEARSVVPDQTHLSLVRDGKETELTTGQDANLTARGELDGSTEASMVFVGYGMSIPSAGWDELSKANLRGKVAVYVNAFPPAKVSDNVKSHINTAEERWAVLKKAGAIGIATIAAPRAGGAGNARGGAAPGAARGAAASGGDATAAAAAPPARAGGAGAGGGRGGGTPQPTIMLADKDLQESNGELVSMTLTRAGADKVLAGTGHTMDEIEQLVRDGKPLPTFALPGTLKAHGALKRDMVDSTNVAGILEGSDPALKNEYVIMSAHLDHVGIGRAVNGDNIYNGAMDDASGVASVIEMARLLKATGAKLKRSIVFIAVTAEEKGLLGSRYYAAHPTVPFGQIIADINLDMFLPLYQLKVIEVQGLVESSLGDDIRAAAKQFNVNVQTDREPDQNRFIRSDQYSFIKRGVPSLAFKFGYEFGSPEETIRKNFVSTRYHQPTDDLTVPVNLDAAATFNRVIRTLLVNVANDPARPHWNPDSYFKVFAK